MAHGGPPVPSTRKNPAPFTARLFVCSLLVCKALGRLILTFLPRAAFILLCCIGSPIATKITFWKLLDSCNFETGVVPRGWYCLNSSISFLKDLNFSSTPLIITGMMFFLHGLGCTGVLRGDSEEPGLGWLASVGELLALRFLLPRVTSMNPSP